MLLAVGGLRCPLFTFPSTRSITSLQAILESRTRLSTASTPPFYLDWLARLAGLIWYHGLSLDAPSQVLRPVLTWPVSGSVPLAGLGEGRESCLVGSRAGLVFFFLSFLHNGLTEYLARLSWRAFQDPTTTPSPPPLPGHHGCMYVP
jgi:hypothetical protein